MTQLTTDIARLGHVVAAKDAAWTVLPIVMADLHTGEIVFLTQFAADLFGYSVEELTGKPLEILVPEEVRATHEVWRKDANVPKTRLMGLGRQVIGKRKDGTAFPCHVGLTAMVCQGRQVGIAFVVDLTTVIQAASGTPTPSHGIPVAPTPETPAKELTGPKIKAGVGKTFGILMFLLGLAAVLFVLFFWKSMVGGDYQSPEDLLALATDHMKRGEYVKAEKEYRHAEKSGADPYLSLLGKAESLFHQQRYEESLNACRELIAAVPNCGRGYYLRGLVLNRMGRTEEAHVEFVRAAGHGDRYAIARLQRKEPVHGPRVSLGMGR